MNFGSLPDFYDHEADFESHHISGVARAAYERGLAADFNAPLVSHIDGNLWMGGCLDGVRLTDDFKHVLSLFKWGQYKLGKRTDRIEIEMYDSDKIVPEEQLHEIVDRLHELVTDGQTLVHCQAGLNRSGLISAFYLMKYRGMPAEEAIELLRNKRHVLVLCNQHFEQWLLNWRD